MDELHKLNPHSEPRTPLPQLRDRLHRQKEMLRVIEERLEAEVAVERDGIVVDRVDDHRVGRDLLARTLGALEGIDEEKLPEPSPLMRTALIANRPLWATGTWFGSCCGRGTTSTTIELMESV
jgi:hypothetical protein